MASCEEPPTADVMADANGITRRAEPDIQIGMAWPVLRDCQGPSRVNFQPRGGLGGGAFEPRPSLKPRPRPRSHPSAARRQYRQEQETEGIR